LNGRGNGDHSLVVDLVDFILRSNWDGHWLGIRSSDGNFNGEFLNVDFGRVLDGHLWCDLGDGAGRCQHLFLGDELIHGWSIFSGVAHEGAQVWLHDLSVLADDDGSLGIVDAGLECGCGDGDGSGGVVDWSRSGNLNGGGHSVRNGSWCCNSDWGRSRCGDGYGEVVSDLGLNSYLNWSWCCNGDWGRNRCGNGSGEIVFNLGLNYNLDGLRGNVSNWSRSSDGNLDGCGNGNWGRGRCGDGSREIVFNLGLNCNLNWSSDSNGSRNGRRDGSREVVFNLGFDNYLDGLRGDVSNWSRSSDGNVDGCGNGDWSRNGR
jgi:hypothetical protein